MSRRMFLMLLVLLWAPLAAHAQKQSDEPPPLAKESFEKSITLLIEQRQYDETVAACDRAIQQNANFLPAYIFKWEAMMKRPDFETQAGFIRLEIEKLLAENQSERALSVAAKAFELLADEQAVQKIENRVLADFPKSDWAQNILGRRALAELDHQKRTDLLEAF